MLCEVCKNNQATFFYKQTKNGFTVEKNLCAECAKKQGLGISSGFLQPDGFADDFFGGFLGSFLEPKPQIVASQTCTRCGMTMGELMHGGRVGCSSCYTVFRKALMPTVTKIHGNVAHCGKVPGVTELQKTAEDAAPEQVQAPEQENAGQPEDKLSQLKKKLRDAIEQQEYEDAAKYRDEIRAIEAEMQKGSDGEAK